MHSTMQEAQIDHEVLYDLLSDQIGVARKNITVDTDIERDLSCTGEDFNELMDAYSKRFNVDMSDYRWYFHTQEEGFNIGSMVFNPPNERVERIPVTPKMLAEFAVHGKWGVAYPEHQLPKYRLDLAFNTLLFLLMLCWVLYRFVW